MIPTQKSRRSYLKSAFQSLSIPALTSLGLVGCTSQPSSSRDIRMGLTGRPQMLDPRKATDALSTRINRLIYRQLIDFDEQFLPKPDLAEWQEVSAKQYRLTLIEESFFHDSQTPLTAEDVASTYQSVLNPELGSAHRGSLLNIEKIQVLNPKQLDFFLKEEDALFIGRLVIGIVPKSLIEKDHPFQKQPIGSGACRFLEQSPQKLRLQRLADQQELAFFAVKDATVRVLKLRNQELDIIQNDLSPELVHYCEQQSDLSVLWQKGTNFGYIGFNFEDPLLSQFALRKAIAVGIDRPAVIQAIFKGHARLAQALLTPEHWAGINNLMDYAFDPAESKRLVKQVIEACLQNPKMANFVKFQTDANGKQQAYLELSYKTSNDPTRIRLATIYQAQLKKVGIQLKIQSYDWGTFYNDIKKGRFQLYSLAWVGVKSPDIFQYVFHSNALPPKGANRGRFIDAQSDQLIDQALQNRTLSGQASLYRKLQTRLQQELAAMPLWYEDQYAVVSDRIRGYQLYTDGRYDGLLTTTLVTQS